MMTSVKALVFIDIVMLMGLALFRWALSRRDRSLLSVRMSAIILLTPAVALFCGSIYIFCLYLAGVIALSSRSRGEIAGTYLAMLPTVPILTAQTGIGGIYLLGISSTSAMGLGALIGVMTTKALGPKSLKTYTVAIIVIMALAIFTYHSFGPTALLRGIVANSLTVLAPYLLISRSAQNVYDVERLLCRLLLGGVLVSVTACFQAKWHWIVFETYYAALHVGLPALSGSLSVRAGMLRTGGSLIDYSAAGLFLAVVLTTLPLIKHKFQPTGYCVIFLIIILGLLVTQSRGSWVAAIVSFAFVAAYRRRWLAAISIIATAVIAETVVLVCATSGKLAQIMGQTDEAAGNVVYRRELFQQGISQVLAHPMFGQSPQELTWRLQSLKQGDHIVDFVNTHLFVAMSAGIPAFLIWSLIWFMPILQGWRRRKAKLHLTAAPAAIVVPTMIALTFTSMNEQNMTWPVIALGLASIVFSARRDGNVTYTLSNKRGGVSGSHLSTALSVMPLGGFVGVVDDMLVLSPLQT